jgi:chromosome segregation ATPase
LENVNGRVTELSDQLRISQAENQKFKVQVASLTKENQSYFDQIQEQSAELATLSPLKQQLQDALATNTELTQSLVHFQATAKGERAKRKSIQARASNQALMIKELTAQISESAGSNVDLEAKISGLTSHAEALESQVATLTLSAERAQQLGNNLDEVQEQLEQLLAKNRELSSEIDEITAEAEQLKAENEALRSIAESVDTVQASRNAAQKENQGLSEDLTAVEQENRSLSVEIQRLTEQISALQSKLSDAEKDNRTRAAKFEKSTVVNGDLRTLTQENEERCAENRRLAAQNARLQSQLESKSATLTNVITELESVQKSHRIDRQTIGELRAEIARLTGANAGARSTPSRPSAPPSKVVEILNSQVQELNAEISGLLKRNSKLEEQARTAEQEIRELRAVRATTGDGNDEIPSQTSEALSRRVAELSRALTLARRENRRHMQEIDNGGRGETELPALRARIKELEEEKADFSANLEVLLKEKNDKICELQAQFAKKWEELDLVVRKIEISLQHFPVTQTEVRPDDTIIDRLEAILSLLHDIQDLVDTQTSTTGGTAAFGSSTRYVTRTRPPR